MSFPKERTGYEVGGVALVAGSENKTAAQAYIDWTLTADAQNIGPTVGSFQILTNPNAVVDPHAARPLGPSGCGKTTTLRMIAGFESPTSGSVLLGDEDMLSLTPDRRPMAMVFQSYALFPHMTVFENVAYGLRLKKMSKKQIEEEVGFALASMSLTNLADRAPNQLSGGQQQRVALARAMVVKPKVLLFDEIYRHPESVLVADFIGRANFLDVTAKKASKKADHAEVTVLGKSMTVRSHRRAVESEASVLLVRPEAMRVRPLADDEERVAGNHGRVLNAVFYGESVEYEIETEVGNIVAVESDPRFEDIVPVGGIVGISFDPERTWLLPADD